MYGKNYVEFKFLEKNENLSPLEIRETLRRGRRIALCSLGISAQIVVRTISKKPRDLRAIDEGLRTYYVFQETAREKGLDTSKYDERVTIAMSRHMRL